MTSWLNSTGHQKFFSIGVGTCQRALEVLWRIFENCIVHYSSLKIVDSGSGSAMSMQMAHGTTETLSNKEFAQAVGDAKLKDIMDRTELDKVLVKCEMQLKTRSQPAQGTSRMFCTVHPQATVSYIGELWYRAIKCCCTACNERAVRCAMSIPAHWARGGWLQNVS